MDLLASPTGGRSFHVVGSVMPSPDAASHLVGATTAVSVTESPLDQFQNLPSTSPGAGRPLRSNAKRASIAPFGFTPVIRASPFGMPSTPTGLPFRGLMRGENTSA